MEEIEKIVKRFPSQCEDAINIAKSLQLPIQQYEGINKIVVAGMGGSAAGGDLLKDYLEPELNIPIFVYRNYDLGQWVDNNTLVFAVSYSGNTEETLSCYYQAYDRGCKIIGISSNGKIEEVCVANNTPLVKIPQGFAPRFAFGYLFFPILIILIKILNLKDKEIEIEETINILKQISEEGENFGKEIAKEIVNHLPLIYAPQNLSVCAVRWKNQLNENSKHSAYYCLFPELNHNEIEMIVPQNQILKNCFIIFLKDIHQHPRINRRIAITQQIIKNNSIPFREIFSKGDSYLARLFSLIYYADWVSIALARIKGVDPLAIPNISFLKKELSI